MLYKLLLLLHNSLHVIITLLDANSNQKLKKTNKTYFTSKHYNIGHCPSKYPTWKINNLQYFYSLIELSILILVTISLHILKNPLLRALFRYNCNKVYFFLGPLVFWGKIKRFFPFLKYKLTGIIRIILYLCN